MINFYCCRCKKPPEKIQMGGNLKHCTFIMRVICHGEVEQYEMVPDDFHFFESNWQTINCFQPQKE